MNKLHAHFDFFVGIFLLLSFAAVSFVAIQLGDFSFLAKGNQFRVTAEFSGVAGLREGAGVEIAGVPVGKVETIRLNDDLLARVTMLIDNGVKIDDEAIASIRTMGVIGEKYIKILPGASDIMIEDGGSIVETEAAVELEELISKFIFSSE